MMIYQYAYQRHEFIQATLDFLEHRPPVRIMLGLISFLSGCLLIGFALQAFYLRPTIVDSCFACAALSWLLWRRRIQEIILTQLNSLFAFQPDKITIKCTSTVLDWHITSTAQGQQPWKKVSFIYKNKVGYFIPRTGFFTGGQFIWLPHRAFTDPTQEKDFENLIYTLNITIRRF